MLSFQHAMKEALTEEIFYPLTLLQQRGRMLRRFGIYKCVAKWVGYRQRVKIYTSVFLKHILVLHCDIVCFCQVIFPPKKKVP